MSDLSKKQLSATERMEIFGDNFGEIDPGYSIVELMRGIARYLSLIVDKENVSAGMTEMIRPLIDGPIEPQAEKDFEELFDSVFNAQTNTWPLGEKLSDLAAYAYYGVAFPPLWLAEENSTEEWLATLVREANEVAHHGPLDKWLHDPWREKLVELVTLARNRWALDNNQSIEPGALAKFGGVTEARIRNMMAGANSRFTNKEGLVPAPEALAWLADRESFFDSIWREQPKRRREATKESVMKPAFLPVARDGSVFHPGLARKQGFQIGPKGEERYIDNFQAALSELQRMEIPYWRRPNEKGKPGIVRGIKWQRYDLNALPAFLVGFQGGEINE